jgi:glycosyltransferase involved in cell wall biosynthesis
LFDISLCIPTRNRAPLLARGFEHLLTFKSLDFEVIVGDNASTDDTREVVARYAGRFRHVVYRRHAADIGFVRNMDAILRLARGKYCYVVSDDDMVFESALLMMKAALDDNPETAAVTGKYQSSRRPEIGLAAPRREVNGFFVRRGDFAGWFAALVKDPMLCDGHPFMRTEYFQRHCGYEEGSIGLERLHTRLLEFGDLLFVDQPVFQHFRNPESLSNRMTEPWFRDAWHADVELAFAGASHGLPRSTLDKRRKDVLQILYLQSARMARIREDHELMWHFLRRAKAVGGVDEACLVQIERTFLVDLVMRRLQRLFRDLGITSVFAQDTPLLDAVRAQLQALQPGLAWLPGGAGPQPGNEGLRLFDAYDSGAAMQTAAGAVMAFRDVVDAARLTAHPIDLAVAHGRVVVEFPAGPAAELARRPSDGYAILMADYADIEPDR